MGSPCSSPPFHINSVELGPGRDITGELAEAVRAEGLKLVTTLHHQFLWGWYPTYNNLTDAADPRYELTATAGGLYGPKVAGPQCFTDSRRCPTTGRFNDYWLAKVLEIVDQYEPDVLYFDAKQNIIDEQHRLDYLAHYYNAAAG